MSTPDMVADPREFDWFDQLPAPGAGEVQLVKTDRQVAIERERNRQEAIATVAAERATTVPTRTGRVKMSALMAQAVAELEVRREHGAGGFKTGVDSFDARVAPLFTPGHLIVVAARTKRGKTTILAQWAASFAAQGLPVMHFSFEDDGTEVANRHVANVGSGDIGAIRAGFVLDGVKQPIPQAFDVAAKVVSEFDIDFSDVPATCTQLAFEVGDWVASWPQGASTGVVIVDQLSHIVPDDPATFAARFPNVSPPPPAHDLTKLHYWQSKMLRVIAKRWNVLVILAHQLNASQPDHVEPTEDSLYNSKGIGHVVDGLIIPWRPRTLLNPVKGPGEPETVPNIDDRMWLVVPIARQCGGEFKVEVAWQPTHQRIAELGTPIGQGWQAPEPVTEAKMAGMAARAKLQSGWQAYIDKVRDAANGAGEAPQCAPAQLKAIGQFGIGWALPPVKVKAAQPEPAPEAPWLGQGGYNRAF